MNINNKEINKGHQFLEVCELIIQVLPLVWPRSSRKSHEHLRVASKHSSNSVKYAYTTKPIRLHCHSYICTCAQLQYM